VVLIVLKICCLLCVSSSIGLMVVKPIVIDNKGAIDYINTWSSGERMRHACVKLNFLRELKEAGLVEVE
jgi:hypothetical protein